MRLLVGVSLLSLLALSRYAHAAAVVGYPYRTEVHAYSPARGEYPVVNSLNQGFVRYVDQQGGGGAHHLIGYKYAEPVQSRRITNEEYLNQLVKSSINKDESESNKAREEHFRLWSMNQYDQYRQETERLKANGQEPSAELLTKIKTLEDIIISNSPSTSGDETPQSKQVREEHLRIWNAGRSAAAAVAQFASDPKISGGSNQPVVAAVEAASSPNTANAANVANSANSANPAIYLRFQSAHEVVQNVVPVQAQAQAQAPAHVAVVGESDEQKKAREEHLRIYQEQLQLLQKAHAEAVRASNINSISSSSSSDSHHTVHQLKDARAQHEAHAHVEQQQQGQQAQQVQQAHGVHTVEHVSYIEETPEVQRAKAEHLRLWQEAKERAEKEGHHQNVGEHKVNANEHHHHQPEANSDTKSYKPEHVGHTSAEHQAQQQQGFTVAQQDRKYAEGQQQQHHQNVEEHKVNANEHHHHQPEVHTDTKSYKPEHVGHTSAEHQAQQQQGFTVAQQDRKYAEGQQQQHHQEHHHQHQQITDKSDTVTIFAATQSADKYQGKLYGQQQNQQHQQHYVAPIAEHANTENNPLLPTPVQDTPEVQRARAEHLRILEELQAQAERNKQRFDVAPAQQPAFTTQPQQQYDNTATKFTTTDVAALQPQVNAAVPDTVEVQRAREEHLKLLKEAHLKATQYQSVNAQANTNEAQSTTYSEHGTPDKSPEQTQSSVESEEARLRAEEAKQREAERLAELARLKEEQRLLDEEQKRLQLEEQRRQEQERAEQARLEKEKERYEETNEKSKNDEHYAERPQLPNDEKPAKAAEQQQSQQKSTQTDGTERAFSSSAPSSVGHDREKFVVIDPQFVRFIPAAAVGGNQAGSPIPTTAFYIGAEQSAQPQPLQNYANAGYYYLRNVADGSYIKMDNPYFLQYIPNQSNANGVIATVDTTPFTTSPLSPTNIKIQAGNPLTKNYQILPATGSPPTYNSLLGTQAYVQGLSPYKQTLGPSPNTQYSAYYRPPHGSLSNALYSPSTASGSLPYKPSIGSSLGPSSGINSLSLASALFAADNAANNAITPFSNPNKPTAAQAPAIFPLQPITAFSDAAKTQSGSDPGLAALEQATRDHFRAHELAVAQLRSANVNQAEKKDC